MATTTELLQGTLDLLILKAISLGPLHGYVFLRIQQVSRDKLQIQQGSLYPALYRLEHQGLITSAWGSPKTSGGRRLPPDRGREAPVAAGAGLPAAPVEAIGLVLAAVPDDV